MSKIFDILNRRSKPEDKPASNPIASDPIQEELARTFFTPSVKKRKKTPKTLFLIATMALLLTFAVIALMDNAKVFKQFPQEDVFFLKDGKPDTYLVKDVYFSGDAPKFSRTKSDMLVLINSGGSGWANFSIELKEPVNMKELDLLYTARGQMGDEYLVIVLVDVDNNSYRMERDLSSALTTEWQEYRVNLKPVNDAISMSAISIVKFEFGSLTAGNCPSATIFLKDIYVAKRRGIK